MQKPYEPTDADLRVARVINSIPASYVNKTFVTSLPTGMRLTFTEVNPSAWEEEVARAAVLLSYDDVESLIMLLRQQMDATTTKIDMHSLAARKE